MYGASAIVETAPIEGEGAAMDAEPQQAAQGPQCEDFGSCGWSASCSWSCASCADASPWFAGASWCPKAMHWPAMTDAMPCKGTMSATIRATNRRESRDRMQAL